MQGSTSKTREKLAVVDELLNYWRLDEAEDVFEELEEALIVSGESSAAPTACFSAQAQTLGRAPR